MQIMAARIEWTAKTNRLIFPSVIGAQVVVHGGIVVCYFDKIVNLHSRHALLRKVRRAVRSGAQGAGARGWALGRRDARGAAAASV